MSNNDLDNSELDFAFALEVMMQSETWQKLQVYWLAQWEQIIDDTSKARNEPNWRAQQGKLKGFKMCWEIPLKLVKRANDERSRRETEDIEKEKEAQGVQDES